MAYRKVDDASLASVADAIREKTGTSDALVFPEEFVSAISAIGVGDGSGDSATGSRYTNEVIALPTITTAIEVIKEE